MYLRRTHQETNDLFQDLLRGNDYPKSKYLYRLGEQAIVILMDDLFAELDVTLVASSHTVATPEGAHHLAAAATSHLGRSITSAFVANSHTRSWFAPNHPNY